MEPRCLHKCLKPQTPPPLEFYDLWWECQSAPVECQDCGERFNAIRYRTYLGIGDWGSWKIVDPARCSHSAFVVDEASKSVIKEHSLKVPLFRFVTGQSFYVTTAKCSKCSQDLVARASFREEWKNKSIVQIKTTPWKIVAN